MRFEANCAGHDHLPGHQYHFQVINHDPDDNIFTDCAITAGADYIVTEDRHFAPLATAGYHPQPISPVEFIYKHL